MKRTFVELADVRMALIGLVVALENTTEDADAPIGRYHILRQRLVDLLNHWNIAGMKPRQVLGTILNEDFMAACRYKGRLQSLDHEVEEDRPAWREGPDADLEELERYRQWL